jgi:regulatory protein
MTKPRTRPTLAQARLKAEQYCAYQERCHKEVTQKLYNLGLAAEEVQDVLLHLMQHNFLNEERFAKAFVRGKHKVLGWGRNKIVYHLKAKGINTKLIELALQELNEQDYETELRELIEKKNNLLKEEDNWKRMVKVSRYLSSKGYEPEHFMPVLKTFYGL